MNTLFPPFVFVRKINIIVCFGYLCSVFEGWPDFIHYRSRRRVLRKQTRDEDFVFPFVLQSGYDSQLLQHGNQFRMQFLIINK